MDKDISEMTDEELLELLMRKISIMYSLLEAKVQGIPEDKPEAKECVKNHEFEKIQNYWEYTDPTEKYKPRVYIPTENLRM